MKGRTLTAVMTGAVCALVGPAIVHSLTDDPASQLALSLMIAVTVVIVVLVGIRRS
jgi:hypothetical protein